MKKKWFTVPFILFLTLGSRALAQPQLPSVIPPSPAVANFLRYGDIPVDYSTGVPNISVPLYTVKGHKLELPISISYHASGIKVEDKASVVGLGWVLNSGGFVAENVLGGAADDAPSKLPTYWTTATFEHGRDSAKALDVGRCAVSNLENFGSMIWTEMTPGDKDFASDRYTFHLPDGEMGAFRYQYNTQNLIKAPYTGAKIQKLLSGGSITGFKITDEKGNVYTFGIPSNWNARAVNTRSWDLLSIVSADKSDTIRFVYKAAGNVYLEQDCVSALDFGQTEVVNGNGWIQNGYYSFTNTYTNTYTAERITDSIISSGTVVKFTDVSGRQDMAQGFDSMRVTNITVYDRLSGRQIKSFNFGESYFGTTAAGNLRLRLDSVSISGQSSTTVETYRFKYNTSNGDLPGYPENQVPIAYPTDYWGYFNGAGGTSLIPYGMPDIPDSIQGLQGGVAYLNPTWEAVHTPVPGFASDDIIQEVDYPTGGKTVFAFEANSSSQAYSYGYMPNDGNYVGGLRVQKISNYDQSGQLTDYKSYTYSDGMTIPFSPELFEYAYRIVSSNAPIIQRPTFYSSPFIPLKLDNGPPVFYSTVTEYHGDTSGNNVGKTQYIYNVPPAEFHPTDSVPPYDQPFFYDTYDVDLGDYQPLLASKIESKNQSGVYIPVRETDYYYDTILSPQYFTGLHLSLWTNYMNGASDMSEDYRWCTVVNGDTIQNTTTLGYPYYIYPHDVQASQQMNILTKQVVSDFSPDGTKSMMTTTLFTYGDLNSYTYGKPAVVEATEQDIIDSKGDTLKTIHKFPDNFTGTVPYDSMVSRNMIDAEVEADNYKNSGFLQSQITNYANWSSTLIAPQTVQTKVLANAVDTRIQYMAYDARANITSVAKQNDVHTTYLWNYSGNYPVAQVTNADSADIAYTSFEGDDKGRWSFSGTPNADITAPTGRQVYLLNGSNNITRAGLTSATTYIVSYWTNTGSSLTITGTLSGYPVTGRKVGSWTYYEHRVTGQTSVTITGTGVAIDELRLYPSTAQMAT